MHQDIKYVSGKQIKTRDIHLHGYKNEIVYSRGEWDTGTCILIIICDRKTLEIIQNEDANTGAFNKSSRENDIRTMVKIRLNIGFMTHGPYQQVGSDITKSQKIHPQSTICAMHVVSGTRLSLTTHSNSQCADQCNMWTCEHVTITKHQHTWYHFMRHACHVTEGVRLL